MQRARAIGLGLLLALPSLGPAAMGSAGASVCAAEAAAGSHAALVVDTGARTTTYCVSLDAASVNGLHLLQLAGAQYGLTYRLGFGGQALCQLNGIGPAGGDCFSSYPDFWGYWHGDASGGWTWAGTGAASASVGDGDVEGWSWGSGDSGATHPAPPSQRLEDVCVPSPKPTPSPSAVPTPRATPTPAGGAGPASGNGGQASTSPAGTASGAPRASERSPPTQASTTSLQDSPGSEIVRAVAPVGGAPASAGPPAGALLALGAAALLGAGGWLARRRRRREGRV